MILKKKIATLEKCYSIAPLTWNDQNYLLVAAEKQDPCYLFDLEGNRVDKVWDGPGGAMSMVQIPGSNGHFLATQKFYSPNDSAEAKIVSVRPEQWGNWDIQVLVELPFVHRFDILQKNGKKYLIACTLKSGHEFKEDWRSPGKIYVGLLPDDPGDGTKLELTVLKDGLYKNHGYWRAGGEDGDSSIISCEQGIFQVFPPETDHGEWAIKQLTHEPASDGILIDLDNDGIEELCAFTPFHGDQIHIYKPDGEGLYQSMYQYPVKTEFLHAIFGGKICGRNVFIAGHRKGARDLLLFYWDDQTGTLVTKVIDQDSGSANIYKYNYNGKDILISANREINEIAMYVFTLPL